MRDHSRQASALRRHLRTWHGYGYGLNYSPHNLLPLPLSALISRLLRGLALTSMN